MSNPIASKKTSDTKKVFSLSEDESGYLTISGNVSGLVFKNSDAYVEKHFTTIEDETKKTLCMKLLGDGKENMKRDFGGRKVNSCSGLFKSFITNGELPIVDGLEIDCMKVLLSNDIEKVKDMLIAMMMKADRNSRSVSDGYFITHNDLIKSLKH